MELKKIITNARKAAAGGVRSALEALAVHHREPYPHQTSGQRTLRNQLRARARQLGDVQEESGALSIDRLVQECAYEHWHRMLFARFLAENDLLIEPESGVPISLDECGDLAKAGNTDLWTLASRFAQQMLPQIFCPDDPLLQVELAPEHCARLEDLLASLEAAVFTADDALGWAYQFWQSENNEKVNKSEVKIGAEELPAVTQFFTDDYMVYFLLHNTLGAWWAGKKLAKRPELAARARTEEDLRRALELPGVSWNYLRFVRAGETWRPAAGSFKHWPERARDLRLLDPCMGSGHFLVAALPILAGLRMDEEGLPLREACDAVLKDNLFGLELDPRCSQIAAFSLALAAWKMGGFRSLPRLNLACSGLCVGSQREKWIRVLEKHGLSDLRFYLGLLYDLFIQAPVLGSLINPARFLGRDCLDETTFRKLFHVLEAALTIEDQDAPEEYEMGVAAQGMARAAHLLAGRYHLVVTNVPYLARGKHGQSLRRFCEENYPAAKSDLATVFLDRCLEFCAGSVGLVLPQNWFFLTSYRTFRERLLRNNTWHLIANIGYGGFKTPLNVAPVLIVMDGEMTGKAFSVFPGEQDVVAGRAISSLDVSDARSTAEKAVRIITIEIKQVRQSKLIENPESRISMEELRHGVLLESYASCVQGLRPADRGLLVRLFWEVDVPGRRWRYLHSTSRATQLFSGMQRAFDIITFDEKWRELGSAYKGHKQWGRWGVAMSQMGNLPATLYTGAVYDGNINVFDVRDEKHLPAVWAYCSSSEFIESVRKIDKKNVVTNATLVKVPFDLARWQKLAAEKCPNGLPKPYSDDPTQWIFHGHPKPCFYGSALEPPWPTPATLTSGRSHGISSDIDAGSIVSGDENRPVGDCRGNWVLQVAVARLLGYLWPAELDKKMELSEEARAWIAEAHKLDIFADADGIVCLPSVRGEEPAASRLRALLAAAFGPDWSPARERGLIASAGSKAADLEEWLRESFFEQHCKIFHHRPFIWHVWDGRKRDGFHAFINCHWLAEGDGQGRRLLENLTYSYLGDWIKRQEDGVQRCEDGADGRLVAALELQKRLVAILEGEPPFDLFVRWKPLHQQPIGWEPDINDGVRVNIRPFLTSNLPGGANGAGVLRWKPNIKWGKDRGKEPTRPKNEYPWFWGWDEKSIDFMGGREFDRNRWNDCHYTNETKRLAREIHEEEQDHAEADNVQ